MVRDLTSPDLSIASGISQFHLCIEAMAIRSLNMLIAPFLAFSSSSPSGTVGYYLEEVDAVPLTNVMERHTKRVPSLALIQ